MKLNKFIALLFLLSSVIAKAENLNAVWDSANAAYTDGRYEDAIKMYEQILAENKESAALYFNLGNAYFKTNNIGPAILNYERAKKLDPDDENINANLKLANQKTEDKIEAAPQFFLSQWKNTIVDAMSEKDWSILLIVSIIVSLLLFAIYVTSGGKALKQLGFYGGSALLVLSVILFFTARSKYDSTVNGNSAIVTSASVVVNGSPSAKGTRLFILHEGTKVDILQQQDDWTEVKIANGNVGWLKASDLEKI